MAPPQRHQSLPQRIELGDGKRPVAALRAPQPANQTRACPQRRIGQRRIHNLHKFPITLRQTHADKDTRLAST